MHVCQGCKHLEFKCHLQGLCFIFFLCFIITETYFYSFSPGCESVPVINGLYQSFFFLIDEKINIFTIPLYVCVLSSVIFLKLLLRILLWDEPVK